MSAEIRGFLCFYNEILIAIVDISALFQISTKYRLSLENTDCFKILKLEWNTKILLEFGHLVETQIFGKNSEIW